MREDTIKKWVGIPVIAAFIMLGLTAVFNTLGIGSKSAIGLLLIGIGGLYVLKIHKRGLVKEDFISMLFFIIAAMGISTLISTYVAILPVFQIDWGLTGFALGIMSVLLADVVLEKM